MNCSYCYHHHCCCCQPIPVDPKAKQAVMMAGGVTLGVIAAGGLMVLAMGPVYLLMWVMVILLDNLIDWFPYLVEYAKFLPIPIIVIVVLNLAWNSWKRSCRYAQVKQHHGHTYAYYQGAPAEDQWGHDYLIDGVDEGYKPCPP